MMARKKSTVTSKDRRRYARARTLGEEASRKPSAVVDAGYDQKRDRIEVVFRCGMSVAIPRNIIPELENALTPDLTRIEISPAGDALSWPLLDVDLNVPGLLDRALNVRHFRMADRSRRCR